MIKSNIYSNPTIMIFLFFLLKNLVAKLTKCWEADLSISNNFIVFYHMSYI